MNERILEELEAQCLNTQTAYFDGRGNVTSTYFDRKKFADLVLFECIKIAVFHGDKTTAAAIKQHFGVEL